MQRQDAEKEIRSITRTCRGPHVATTAIVVAALAAAITRDRARKDAFLAHPENDPADLPDPLFGEDHEAPWFTQDFQDALSRRPTPSAVATALLEAGHLRAAAFVDTVARGKGCGADFNAIVAAGPLDGEAHEYECPKCEVKGTYTAPKYELEASETAGDHPSDQPA